MRFVAQDAAGNEQVETRTVTRAALPWRAPLAAAKAAAAKSPPDWEAAAVALAAALAGDVPSSEVPRALEKGVETWTAPASIAFDPPGDRHVVNATSAVGLRVATPREDDVVRVSGKLAGAGVRTTSATVLLQPGATAVVAEVVDARGESAPPRRRR